MIDIIIISFLVVIVLSSLYYEGSKYGLDVFSPYFVFLSYFSVMFIFKPVEMMVFRSYEDKTFTFALLYVLIGMISFIVGYHTKLGRSFAYRAGTFPDNRDRTKTIIAFFASSALGFILYALILRMTDIGGINGAFSNMWNFRIKAFSLGMAYISTFMQYLLTVPMLFWYTSLIVKNKNTKFSWLIFAAFFTAILVIFASFGARGIPVALCLSLMISYNYLNKKVSLRAVSFFIIILLFFSAAAGIYRAQAMSDTEVVDILQGLSSVSLSDYVQVITDRLDPFPNFLILIDNFPTSTLGYQYGRTYLNLFLQPFPRSLLPEKPMLIGDIYTQEYFPHDFGWVGKDPSLFGELYMNFHVTGIFIGMFFFGILCRFSQEYIRKNHKKTSTVIFYCVMFVFPTSYLMAGINSSATINFFYFMLFYFAYTKLIEKKQVN
jgi:oligosaccharide repeat unit polymerase